MQKLHIRGGNKLNGEVSIQGAKNAALPMMVASLLLPGGVVNLNRVPVLKDIETMSELLESIGVNVLHKDGKMELRPKNHFLSETSDSLSRRMRASSVVLGPLLAVTGRAVMSLPGGCAIGNRPIDLHLKGLERMGAEIKMEHGKVTATADKLVGTRIYLDFPSVGATENLMMAAVMAEGVTEIENAAREPEIINLASLLQKMGSEIEIDSDGAIRIQGGRSLSNCGIDVIPDRIEAGTFLLAGAVTRGDVTVRNIVPAHVDSLVAKLEEMNVNVEIGGDWVRVQGNGRPRGVTFKTMPYPGFPTDLQPQMMASLSVSQGLSVITESVFDNRFVHVYELKRMGASIDVRGNSAVISGVDKLSGTFVKATDLRAGAALILAGLVAEGATDILNVSHIDRGYEGIQSKLESIGGDLVRMDVPEEEWSV